MDNTKTPFSDTVKYLGITLDRKLSWEPHIDDKINSSKKLMLLINAKLKGIQAPKPKLSNWAYTGVIRPKLMYACMIWEHTITKNIKKSLKTMDRLATRETTLLTRNTLQASIELIIDLIPIELMIKKVGLNAYTRL